MRGFLSDQINCPTIFGSVAKNEDYELKESQAPYNRVFDPEKSGLRPNNDYFWDKY